MGTNYYTANDGEFNSHIGKSSAGWRFLVNADDMATTKWDNLLGKLLVQKTIIDEYGNHIAPSELILRILDKRFMRKHEVNRYVIAHDGPVDFSTGDFSLS